MTTHKDSEFDKFRPHYAGANAKFQHGEIKAKLDAEKKAKKRKSRKPSASGRV